MMTTPQPTEPRKKQDHASTHRPPAISLPKGGGALRSIDEKFSVNPVNGSSSLSIPIPFSHTRAGGPSLTLQYSSGNGNGPFGLGWNLDLHSISRRTDKELPRYRDADDGDVFLLSGAEDLAPEFRQNLFGDWKPGLRLRASTPWDIRLRKSALEFDDLEGDEIEECFLVVEYTLQS